MDILVGLGNPGRTFAETRHNVGFAVIQRLAEKHQVRLDKTLVNAEDGRPAAVFGDYQDGESTVRLVMPLTMMNESGDAIKALAAPIEKLLIICDDVNLPVGAVRLKPQGGAGGHNGLRSCIEALGSENVARLRIGVGVEALPRDLREFVLSPFQSSERPLMKQSIQQAAEACEACVREGIEAAMNRYNQIKDA